MEFENYFDSVDIDVMSKILCHGHDGLPENISNLIIAQNEGCQVLQRGSLTKAIEIKTVMIQGCFLPNLLFLTVLDLVSRTS